ncbi:sigma-70 family RNA polymerase sigma factor [Kitasatospora sp. NBC_01266]|uniref:sigma-70 family RNA polymerase sigma factor n=1 Tax=Kitasatospora sp. NBC_01266 TaxID=2903572 RepID=UPI002E36161A|nr:sigma-70 family RNA polymerase sigma factor [Kitasatospora sp. NBC_01266]
MPTTLPLADPSAAEPSSTAPQPAAARPTLDQATLAELYRLHGGYLLRALQRVTNGDRGKAEDILQETLLRAWQHPEAIANGPEQSRPWLFTVARRIAIDHYRMAAARAQEVSGEMLEDRPLAEDPYERVLASRDIAKVLERLQPNHREVLVELHLNDSSVLEAARRLGVPPGTVKSRNFYAIRALRPHLAEQREYAPTGEPAKRSAPAKGARSALPGTAA